MGWTSCDMLEMQSACTAAAAEEWVGGWRHSSSSQPFMAQCEDALSFDKGAAVLWMAGCCLRLAAVMFEMRWGVGVGGVGGGDPAGKDAACH